MESLIQEIMSLEDRLSDLRSQLRKHSDGFLYLSCLRCYGSLTWETHHNEFCVQELCDEYYGDNGIVDVYTTNPNHSVSSYGTVRVMTLEELNELSKENISMSHAIVDWMTAGYK